MKAEPAVAAGSPQRANLTATGFLPQTRPPHTAGWAPRGGGGGRVSETDEGGKHPQRQSDTWKTTSAHLNTHTLTHTLDLLDTRLMDHSSIVCVGLSRASLLAV